MPELEAGADPTMVLQDIRDILLATESREDRRLRLAEEGIELVREEGENMGALLNLSTGLANNTESQTGMARERTALTREQTRLSTRSTELANVRTQLGRERTFLSEERTDLAVQRTEMARRRTSLSEGRTKMAQDRTHLAEERTSLSTHRTDLAEDRTDLAQRRTVRAVTRTRLSLLRTELARGRTHLALIRTGLAFLTIGLTLFRLFGVSIWSIFDAALVVASLVMVGFGVRGVSRVMVQEKRLQALLDTDDGFRDLFSSLGPPTSTGSGEVA